VRTGGEIPGSEGSAASGGRSDPSEWQRSKFRERKRTGNFGHRNRTAAHFITPVRVSFFWCRRVRTGERSRSVTDTRNTFPNPIKKNIPFLDTNNHPFLLTAFLAKIQFPRKMKFPGWVICVHDLIPTFHTKLCHIDSPLHKVYLK